jgi:RNA polymerase sigma-70 factor (ECF subfamily)
MEPSDRELLQRLAGGDREALGPLMERHYRRLYRIVVSYVRDADEALDGVQETFVKAYCHASRWDGRSEVGAWLTRIAVNEAIDRYRRRRRRGASFVALAIEPIDHGGEDPASAVGRREDMERVGRALATLSDQQRAVFVLRHQEEMTLEEIGRVLGLRLGTVKSSLHRAVLHLRGRLGGTR